MTLTAINFVHVSGRSLYIVDWRVVVVEGGNVLHRVKGRGNRPGEGTGPEQFVRGDMSSGRCPYPGHVIRSPAC